MVPIADSFAIETPKGIAAGAEEPAMFEPQERGGDKRSHAVNIAPQLVIVKYSVSTYSLLSGSSCLGIMRVRPHSETRKVIMNR
jgi:hypothetical protein